KQSSSRIRDQAKKLATSFSGAVTGKGKGAQAKDGLEFENWGDHLAAIALHPSASSKAHPSAPNGLPLVSISTSAASKVVLDDLVTPVSSTFPTAYGTAARPTAPSRTGSDILEAPLETRRRKSEEMGDDERPAFQAAAPPVRRENHARSNSLAHAHTLRSSRTLSQHFAPPPDASSLRNNLTASTSAPSTSNSPTVAFGSPFAPSTSSSHHLLPHPHHTISYSSTSPFSSKPRDRLNESLYRDPEASAGVRPSKKISVEGAFSLCLGLHVSESEQRVSFTGLFSIADRSDEDETGDAFGGGTIPTSSGSRRPSRTKSLSRTSNPLFNVVIPSSTSHPGWTGDGFDTAARKSHATRSPEVTIRTRSRASSTVNSLGTLSESGPAVDRFPHSSNSSLVDSSMELGSPSGLPREVMTPPRRRSEPCFSLFGGSLPAAPTTVGHSPRRAKKSTMGGMLGIESDRRGLSMPELTFEGDDGDGDTDSDHATFPYPNRPRSPIRTSTRRYSLLPTPSATAGLPSRRAASHDSHLLASFQSAPSASLSHANATRKRNANGALLVGSGAPTGSNLAAASPIVAHTSSPAPWHARDSNGDLTEEEDEDEQDEDDEMWDRSMSPGPPVLTDGTTSASSSLSTSLSSHAEGDHVIVVGAGKGPSPSVSAGSLSGSTSTPQFTPQNYKNVKPLQAAFMSAGLVSKRSRPRDSGIGMMSPFAQNSSTKSNSSNELANSTSSTSSTSSLAPCDTSADSIMKPPMNPALANVLRSAAVMPDTPVKRLAFSQNPVASAIVDNISATPPSTTSEEEEEITDQVYPLPSQSQSPSPPFIDNRMLHQDDAARMRWSPRHPPLSPLSVDDGGSSGSNSSQRTAEGLSSFRAGPGVTNEVSPTSALSTRVKGGRPPGWKRPTLFRRRSSGQLAQEGSGAFLSVSGGQLRSGSSSGSNRSMVVDGEPMTPTRSVGAGWSEATQLIDTPTDSPLATPATPAFPPIYTNPFAQAYGAQAFGAPPLATPAATYGRQSFPFSDMEQRRQGRPQVPRHSGSVVFALRQQEFQQSNYFESNFTLLRSIGNGAFSDAFEVYDKPRDGVFAVKRTKHPFGGAKDRLRRLEEVDILRLMSEDPNAHLISLIDAWEQAGHLFIETELCEGGNLSNFLEEYGREHEVLEETRVWKILTEVALGVGHLHDRNVIHLDLKPANIFIDKVGHLKIGDFGLSTRWPRSDPMSIVKGANVPSPGWERESWRTEPGERRVRAKSNGDVPEELEREGDREYIAPEILGGRYGKEADVFSLGLIILEAAANVILPDNGPAWHKLRSNDFSDVDMSRLSSPLIQLLTGMLDKSPDRRLTIDDVVQHPIVAGLATLLAVPENEDGGRPIQGAVVAEDVDFLQRACAELYAEQEATNRRARAGSESQMDLD
ncbi:mitosis inhibitor protein kinase SWE1, partial [Phenoliferia sp. Uapishka_3]